MAVQKPICMQMVSLLLILKANVLLEKQDVNLLLDTLFALHNKDMLKCAHQSLP